MTGKKHKERINCLLIKAVVLLYSAIGERLEETTANEITRYLKKAYQL